MPRRAALPVPPRLSILFASEADAAVILVRGPSAWFHVVRWDTRHDAFEHGAWIRGRIYPERCDLSPDGRLLLYFVMQGRRAGSTTTHAWTGVSRAPWLHALALWPWGSTWGGGGVFDGNRKVVLATGCPVAPHPDFDGRGLEVASSGGRRPAGSAPSSATDKDLPGIPGAEWAGRDQRKRVIYLSRGCLYALNKAGQPLQLADFNGATPDPQPAPEWATRPLIDPRGKALP